MPLTDVYRQFSRARVTDLVSPDDVLQAVRRFPDICVPLRLREFASGAKVVQSTGMDEKRMFTRLVELASAKTPSERALNTPEEEGHGVAEYVGRIGYGVTRDEAASALNIPLPMAYEHLLAAEAAGLLCRDDGPQGLRFFNNFFPTIIPETSYI